MPEVIATPGAADANSFITVEEGDAFASELLHVTNWPAATPDDKARAAITATRVISRECYTGAAKTSGQALPWPRTGMVGRGGHALADDVIPHDLKLATFTLADMLLGEDVTADLEQAAQGLTRIKAGPVELGFRENLGAARGLPGRVRALLVPGWLCDPDAKPLPRFTVL